MDKRRPFFSVIIPVYNETGVVHSLLAYLSSFSHSGGFEVIVVDGNPEGNTIRDIHGLDDALVLKKIVSPKGRGVQMNAGASIAEGRVLLFLHADTRLPVDAFQEIESILFAQKNVVGGAFDLEIDSPKRMYRIIERASSIRSRITRIPYGDQAIFIKAACFREMGGFSNIPIMEDVALMHQLKKHGWKIHITSSRVRTSPRRWEKEGILTCTIRNWILITLYFCHVSPVLLSKFYVKR